MKIKLQILVLLLLFPLFAAAQTWNLANTTVNQCGGTFLDPGGNGNFGNNLNITGTICGTSGQCISLEFNSFDLGSSGDNLFIYDGTSTAAPLVGSYTGSNGPGVVGSTTGCVTFRLVTNNTGNAAGWSASISCHTCYQYPGCPQVNAGPDQNIPCPGSCVNLTAIPTQTAQTSSYTVASIPYTPLPYNKGTDLLVGIDDIFSGVLNLGFNFCFYGTNYNQCVLGANGLISFDLSLANQFNIWNTGTAIPNTGDHTNLITCPYHDIDPSVQNRPNYINFEIVGSAPCRVAKFSWNRVPMFSCNSVYATQEILLYETTNVIETYIYNKPQCNSWNGGEAIHGIENAAGTVGTVVPGRNFPTQWAASLDAQRFTPAGAPAYTITWFQGVTQVGTGATISVCPLTTTTYTARVVYTRCDGTSITVTDDVVVTVGAGNVNVNIAPPAQVGCAAGTSQIQLSASSSSASPTYVWSASGGGNIVSGGNTATPTVNAAGSYTVTVTSGGCTATSSVTVTANNQVPSIVISPPPTLQCNTPSGQIQLNASGTTPAGATFVWSASGGGNIVSGGNTATPTVNAAGNYSVVVTNPANGCTAVANTTITANLTPPDVNLTPPTTINCNTAGGQIALTAISSVNGATFSWTGNGVTGATTSFVNVSQQGTYSVVVTNPANGCTASASTTITVNTAQPSVNVSPPAQFGCIIPPGGMTVTANGSAGVIYSWSGPGIITINNNTVDINQPGTYTVIVTNPTNGCTAQASVTVNQNTTPPNVSITPPTPLTCAGQGGAGTTITASSTSSGVSFEWTSSGGGNITTTPFGPTITANAVGTYTVMVTDNATGCNATASVNLTVNNTPPALNINPPAPLTCATQGGTGTTLTATSVAGATFVWSGAGIVSGGNTATPTVNGTGPYTVVVTDPANGCTAQASVSVTVNNTPPAVNINPPAPLTCATQGGSGTTLTATSVAGATFVWSGTGIVSGGNTATPTVNGTGPYTVVVTDPANGCTAQASVSLTVNNTPPDINIPTPPPLTCASQGATGITLNATSSVAGATFVWSGTGIVSGGNTASPTVNATGTYTVVVTNPVGGCTAQASVSVTVDTTPPDVAVTPPQPLTCLTQAIGTTITASSSAAGAGFVWATSGGNISGSTTGASITATAIGTYNVTVTGSNGCTASSSVNLTQNITPPSASIAPPAPLTCSSQAAPFNLSASTNAVIPNYQWSASGGGAINGPNNIANPSVIGAGTYNVTITDSSNGCSNSATVSVTVNNTPPNVNINPPATLTCANQTTGIQLTATSSTAGVTYQWTGTGIVSGANTASPSVNGTGPYSVVVTDPTNGCTASATVTVPINNNPPDVAIAQPPTIDCSTPNGGQIQLSASSSIAGVTYNWAAAGGSIVSGGNTASPTVVGAGTYSLTVTDPNNGCTNFNSVTIITDTTPPNVIVSPPAQIDCNAVNGQVSISANSSATGATFQWSAAGGGNIVGSAIGNFITVDAPGTYNVTVTAANGCTNSGSTTVTVAPPPATTISGAQTVCSGGPVTLSASPGYASYQWTPAGSGSSQSITVNPTANTTYTVVVTDAFGCTASAAANVPVNLPPSPAIGGSTTFCPGSNTILDAGAGYSSYAWAASGGGTIQGPTTAQTITATTAGNYNVTVTDANGCTGSASVAVSINSVLTPNITGDLSICAGESTQLDAGPGFDTYTWSNSNNGQVITVNSAGTYTVSVTDNAGCSGTAAVTVVQNPNPTPAITGDDSICEGTTTVLSAGSFAQYTWGGDATGFNATLTAGPGTYSVTVTDSNGCTGSDVFTIVGTPNPQPAIVGNQPFCIGQSIVLETASAYAAYQWTASGGGNIQGAANGQAVTATSAGTYTVVVTDANGCTGSDVVAVSTNPNPTPAITGDLGICPGENTTLSATAGLAQYSWNNGAATADINVNITGAYSVTVTDANGCTGSTTTTVLQNNAIPPAITGNTSICSGQSTTLNAVGYATYAWSTGDVTASISVTPATNTTYAVTVSDTNGCTATDDVNVFINPNPQITIGGSTSFCSGGNTVLSVPNTFTAYSWLPNGSTSSIVVIDGGNYSVTVTDGSGCTGSATITVTEGTSLNPVVTGDLSICAGETTTLDAGSGFTSYQWSGGLGSGQTITVNAGGTYTVTVSDASGCSGTGSATVVQPASPAPAISGQAAICIGGSSVLDAGAGFASYTWNNGSFNQTLNVSPATNTTYSVTVSNAAGCTGSDTFDVSINANLTPTITGNDAFCQGQSSTLDAGAGYAQYAWSSGQNTQTINVNAANTYTVTVSDASGCSGTDNFTTTVNTNPTPTITGDFAICAGENTTLDAGSYAAYNWSNTQSSATISVSPASTSNYTVTVTDANGCTGTDAASVTVNSATVPVIDGDTQICMGTGSTLTAVGAYNGYQWSNGENTASVTVSPTSNTTYSVTVNDANGCTAENSINVTVNNNPTPTIGGSTTFCAGESTTLDAGTYATYVWSNGENTQTITVNTSNTYCVTVTDNNGCVGNDCVDVTQSTQLNPVITGNFTICQGQTSVLDAGGGFDTYTWSPSGSTQTISVTTTGTYCVTVTQGSCSGTACVDVTVNPNPTPTIGGTTALCAGVSTTLNAGAGYAAYVWQPGGSFNQSITASTSGNYSVTVTDANTCSGSATVTVNVTPNPTPIIGGDMIICTGETTTLDAGTTAFSQYQWQPNGESSATIDVSAGGVYSVTVTDANGCTGSNANTVQENTPQAPFVSGDTELCNGQSTTIDAGTGYTAYVWTPTGSGQSFTDTPASNTTYAVTVTDANGCTETGNINVSVHSNPVAAIGGSLTFCPGASTTLSAQAGMTTYAWSNGENTMSVVVNTPGQYCVTITDANGCTGTACVDVTQNSQLAPVITGDMLLCEGETTTLDAGIGFTTYQWSVAGETGQTITVNTAGTYTVTVSQGTCSGTGSATVVVNPNPVPSIGGAASICEGNTSTLDAGAGYSEYVWDNGSFGQTYTVSTAGTYAVTVTDSNGCTGTDNFVLTVNTNLTPQITGDLMLCEGETTTLDAGQFDNYVWSVAGQNGQTISATASGNYSVTVTDVNGCSGTDAVTLTVNPNPAPDISGTLTICEGETTTLDAGQFDSYVWSVAGQNGQTISATASGSYSVTVTDANGCSGTDAVTLTVNPCNCIVPATPTTTDNNITLCEGTPNTTAFAAVPATGTSIVWYNGPDAATATLLATGNNFTPTTAGTYYAFALNVPADDCISPALPFTLAFNPQPDAALTANPTTVCVGDNASISFSGTASPTATYAWLFGTGASPTTATGAGPHTVSWASTGNKQISVTVTDNGCSDTASGTVGVSSASVQITPATITIDGSNSAIGTTLEAVGSSGLSGDLSYSWSPSGSLSCADCSGPTANPSETTVYTVVMTDEYGCEASAQATINVSYENIVIIPNAFSPNGDNTSDLFRVSGQNIAEVEIHVRNRWGNEVYQLKTSDLLQGWDGIYNSKPQEIGVYVYYVVVTFTDGKEEFFKGNLTLVR